jgi:hypothetical protein
MIRAVTLESSAIVAFNSNICFPSRYSPHSLQYHFSSSCLNEDPDEMIPVEMTVEELSGLEVEKHLLIVTAVIEFFVEYEEQMFFVMNCDKVVRKFRFAGISIKFSYYNIV